MNSQLTAAAGTSSVPSVDASGATHVGRVRSKNEDAYLIATLQRSILVHDASPEAVGWFTGEPAGTLLIVADGLGGHAGGEIASRVAVQTTAGYLLNVMPWATRRQEPVSGRGSLPDVREQLSSALLAGDSSVKSTGERTGTPQMGTTLTVAFLSWPFLYVAHVGDTRCSLFRSGRLTHLTTDHTLAQQFADQSGGTVEPPFQWHSILWNTLGGNDATPSPQIVKQRLEPNDLLLLCSDGLTKHVPDPEIAAILAQNLSNAERCAALVERANAAGGTDNVTVIVATARVS